MFRKEKEKKNAKKTTNIQGTITTKQKTGYPTKVLGLTVYVI